MKVTLIHPPVYINKNGLTALRPSLPLGLAYIAAVLRDDGHELAVVDALGEAPEQMIPDGDIWRLGLTPEEIITRIPAGTQAIGVTSMWSYSWPIVRELIQKLKAAFPNVPIVCGGEHFTAVPELSMAQAPIDYLVLGEGEETAVALFRALEGGFDHTVIPGVVHRDGSGEVQKNPRRDRIKNVDEIPWPAWEFFDIEAYSSNRLVSGIYYGKTVPILATRGCPYQCTYCSSPNMWTTRWYARTPKDVLDEIQSYHDKYGATNFPFQDLTAILKRDWVVEFCNEVETRGLKITWQLPAGTRSEVIDEEVASLLVRSGCKSLNFAPESGSERTRKHMKKMLTDEKLFRAVRASVKAGLNVGAFFVLAYPTDEKEDLEATVKLAARLGKAGIDDVSAGFFFPLPSTEITRQLEKEGKVVYDDAFLKLPIYVHNTFLSEDRKYNDNFTAKELTRWKYRVVRAFYIRSLLLRPSRWFRIFWNFVRGKETSKMESFLQETMRKLRLRRKPKRTAPKVNVSAAGEKPAAAAKS
ncbi:MAG: B12-binding domain-containing radical SAM protein [Planctomycetes bacterium]|nr:B12-binding domain-containing radical SAM protein [Planctomycetota bacterium]